MSRLNELCDLTSVLYLWAEIRRFLVPPSCRTLHRCWLCRRTVGSGLRSDGREHRGPGNGTEVCYHLQDGRYTTTNFESFAQFLFTFPDTKEIQRKLHFFKNMSKYITSVPREFVLSSSNNGTPLYIYGGTGVGCHLEVGHVAQRSCKRGR